MGKFSVIRVEPVKFGGPIGNLPAGSRIFSLRKDVKPHVHKPGEFYCGTCFHWVKIA